MKMYKQQQTKGGLLLNTKHRPAGSMDKDGKHIVWEEREQIIVLPFEEDKTIMKFSLAPQYADKILSTLDACHWGTLIEFELKNKEVISVDIVEDVLKGFYESKM